MNPQDQQSNYWQHPQDDVAPGGEPPEQHIGEQPSEPIDTAPAQEAKASDSSDVVDDAPIQWAAHEYVHLEKGAGWMAIFVVVVAGLIAVDVFLLQSWTFSVLVVVMAVAVVVYIRRPPRDIQYTLSGKQGLYIGERQYHFGEFKAFGLIKDGDHHSLMLIPVKRFAPGVSVYFPEEVGEQIVDIFGARLPMEELKLDAIDLLVRKLRF